MTLASLVASALTQHRAFGLFMSSPEEELVDWFIERHGRPLAQALSALDSPALRRMAAGTPYVLTGQEEGAGDELAGYFREDSTLGLGELLESRHVFWTLQCRPGAEPAVRLLLIRAALWMLAHHDFETALRYLLDLHKHGYLLDFQMLDQCLSILCAARLKVHTDAEIVALLVELGGTPGSEWRSARWSGADVLSMPALREPGVDAEYLTHAAQAEIDEVRAASSHDAWLLGQYYLPQLMWAVLFTLRYIGVADQLAYFALCARFEEISCDGFPFRAMQAGMPQHFPFAPQFGVARTVALVLQQTCDDWQDRLLVERVVVPDELSDLLMPDADTVLADVPHERLPAPWHLLSAALAPIYGRVVLREPEYALRRRIPMNAEELASYSNAPEAPEPGSDESRRICRAEIGALARTLKNAKPGADSSLLDLYPYCDLALFAEALALDRAGDRQAAARRIEQAILIDPSDYKRWHSFGLIVQGLGEPDYARRLKKLARQLELAAAT
jgi:hypothetical protein